MVSQGLALQSSPQKSHFGLFPQHASASRLHRSASVPKLSAAFLSPPRFPPPTPKKPHAVATPSRRKSRVFSHNAPYPLSYDHSTLNCDALDNLILKNLRGSCTWVDFPASAQPTRCLDLGCGTGAWVIDAASEWPHCHFVGFDLVDIQPPPHRLAPHLASRVKWVHGTFLRPLPFQDGYFDHVHIRQIARGVPENQWHAIIAEVARVLKDGGTVELFEEDIIFPVLPRSSTANPSQRARTRAVVLSPTASVTKYHSIDSLAPHDHAVLEVLFYRVFARRGVHLRPTALVMGVLAAHLHGAGGSPLINFPLPPAPPLAPPRAESRPPTPCLPRLSTEPALPDADTDTESTRRSAESTPATSVGELDDPWPDPHSADPADGRVAFCSDAGFAPRGGAPLHILPEERLAVTEGTLGLNLYRSWQGVLACREAMWDEYCDAVGRKDALLSQIGWEKEELHATDRQRFDALLARYKTDMEARYPISDALVADLQWVKPPVEESREDAGARREVAEARRDALRLERSGIGVVPEASRVCRKGRIFVAAKGACAE